MFEVIFFLIGKRLGWMNDGSWRWREVHWLFLDNYVWLVNYYVLFQTNKASKAYLFSIDIIYHFLCMAANSSSWRWFSGMRGMKGLEGVRKGNTVGAVLKSTVWYGLNRNFIYLQKRCSQTSSAFTKRVLKSPALNKVATNILLTV